MKKTSLLLIGLVFLGFFYRVYGLNRNLSFWTDEDHVAIFARAILERGRPVLKNGYQTGLYQYLWYWLTALSFRLGGISEAAARWPAVIFGSLTIIASYFLGQLLLGSFSGLLSAALITFLRPEILWSRQARPYQALQFFFLLAAIFLVLAQRSRQRRFLYLGGFFLSALLASLCHGLGLVLFFNGLFLIFLFFPNRWLILLLIISFLLALPFHLTIKLILSSFGQFNNFFYYRVFLSHHYFGLSFLAASGVLFLGQWYRRQQQRSQLFTIALLVFPILSQLFLVSFFLRQPFTRYFYIVFPFIIILASANFVLLSQLLKKKKLTFFLLALVSLFLLSNYQQFVFKPQKFYSLNQDMAEIPEVDWQKIYRFVARWRQKHPGAPLLVNWNDLPVWYLGEGVQPLYLVRQTNSKQTTDPLSGAHLLRSRHDLQTLRQNYRQGLAVFDSWDDRLPAACRHYCQKHCQLVFQQDIRQPGQPRPWPVNVYIWSDAPAVQGNAKTAAVAGE